MSIFVCFFGSLLKRSLCSQTGCTSDASLHACLAFCYKKCWRVFFAIGKCVAVSLFFRTVGSLLLGRWWGWGLRRGAALGRRAVLQPGSSSPETCDRRSQYGGCSLPLPLLIVYRLRCLKMLHNLRMGESDRAGGISMEPR